MSTKHIVKDGSRQHVISWVGTADGVIRHCSCPDCEVNAGRQALSGSKE